MSMLLFSYTLAWNLAFATDYLNYTNHIKLDKVAPLVTDLTCNNTSTLQNPSICVCPLLIAKILRPIMTIFNTFEF